MKGDKKKKSRPGLGQFLINNPFVVVGLVAALVVVAFAAARWRSAERVEARVIFEDSPLARSTRAAGDKPRVYYDVTDDPNYHTADRLRDAASVALVLGLYRVNVFAQRQPAPASVDAMISGVASQGLLPPGVSLSPDGSSGVLVGPASTLYVRYRVNPFGVEVVSLPANSRHGDNIIVRLPADGEEAQKTLSGAASVFTHVYVKELELPAPYSSRELVEANGWKYEPLRESNLTPDAVSSLMNSLRRVR